MEKLNQTLFDNAKKMGFKDFTDIKKKSFDPILSRKNVVAKSPTGTGKTAAFLLPILQLLIENNKSKALIIEPTRELVIQASNESRKLSNNTSILVTAAYGGTPADRQIELIKRGSRLVIGTPGRIIRLMELKSIELKEFDIFTLDEADRLMSEQFESKISEIYKHIDNPKEQVLMYCVNISPTTIKMAEKYYPNKDYQVIRANELNGSVIEHLVISTEKPERELIKQIVPKQKIMVFCQTAFEAQKVAGLLKSANIYPALLSSKIKSDDRQTAIKKFKEKTTNVLVCTDIGARGIHFDSVDKIISYRIPKNAQFYLHRAGRTGRMGRKGVCISIVDTKDLKALKEIYERLNIQFKYL